MKHISVIVYEDVVLSSVSGVYSLFVTANQISRQRNQKLPFDIELIGVHLHNVQLNLPVQFHCSRTIDDDFHTDLIIIPGISDLANPIPATINKNTHLIQWLKDKRKEGIEIMSMCTAAYFLAEAGLLDGMEAATHWQAADELQAQYPKVKFRSEKVTVDHGGIITGGGANSSLNTTLYLIEKFCGKSMAIEISRIYAIDYGRSSQNLFSIFQGQRRHHDQKIHEAQTLIEQRFKEDISVEKIAVQVNMSRRNFIRRFKAATGLNPIEYFQRLKIEAAKRALEEGATSISSLPYSVGYSDLKTFRAVFKKTTGYSPLEYQKIYSSNLY